MDITEQLSKSGSSSMAVEAQLRPKQDRPDRQYRPVSQGAGREEGKNKRREANGGRRKPFKDGRGHSVFYVDTKNPIGRKNDGKKEGAKFLA